MAGGWAEEALWFRARLQEIGETQASLARFMVRHGDNRGHDNIVRSICRMAAGDSKVSGEMRALLGFMAAQQRIQTD